MRGHGGCKTNDRSILIEVPSRASRVRPESPRVETLVGGRRSRVTSGHAATCTPGRI
ncbi:hypothetical protein X805_22750 [Sphaerotilus natans subsp. natans DSM 6575]|uniref:Uncharacterized protein n=1 Tax=Sphaerotilus natans subsp. natans DSM 6575 TaxID=1286631 RepID=A0A059KKZ2_9BURK|nr:hypothetical protein X805_22750 [Sphaerotilus natans subsp. natans DSM 6575]